MMNRKTPTQPLHQPNPNYFSTKLTLLLRLLYALGTSASLPKQKKVWNILLSFTPRVKQRLSTTAHCVLMHNSVK